MNRDTDRFFKNLVWEVHQFLIVEMDVVVALLQLILMDPNVVNSMKIMAEVMEDMVVMEAKEIMEMILTNDLVGTTEMDLMVVAMDRLVQCEIFKVNIMDDSNREPSLWFTV